MRAVNEIMTFATYAGWPAHAMCTEVHVVVLRL